MHNEYILTPNGEFYHAKRGVEREDHKYVSREWKNGRWNYVYQTAKKNEAKSNYSVKTPSFNKSITSTISSVKNKVDNALSSHKTGQAREAAGRDIRTARNTIARISDKTSQAKKAKDAVVKATTNAVSKPSKSLNTGKGKDLRDWKTKFNDWLGVDESDAYDKAKTERIKTSFDLDSTQRQLIDTKNKEKEAYDNFLDTPLGFLNHPSDATSRLLNKAASKIDEWMTGKTGSRDTDAKVSKGKTTTSGVSKAASAVGKKTAENTGLNQREDAIEKKREWNSAYAKERKSGSEADKLARKVKQAELNAAHESLMNTPVGKIEKAYAEKAQVWLYRMQAEAKRSRR